MTIDDMMKHVFDSLEVDTHIYAVFEHEGGMYSGEFKVIWIDKERNCVSLTTPNESPYGTCIGVPLKNFFSLVNISNTNKEETIMTDYGRKLEREWRNEMAIGAIYDFMGRDTHGLMRGYTFAGFDGCGEDLKLNFINERTNTPYQIYASDIGRCSLTSTPRPKWLKDAKPGDKFRLRYHDINIDNNIVCNTWYFKKYEYVTDDIVISFTWDPNDRYIEHTIKLSNIICAENLMCENCSKPMQLVKKIEEYKFDEKAFYRATNGVRHFLIENLNDNYNYEALYYGPTLDKSGMHIAFARSVGCGNVTCESAELYHDKIICDSTTDWTKLKLFKGDSLCTYDEIKMDDIFKKEEKLQWDIDKLKVGKAYRIQDIDGNETDGIYTRLYETAVPGQSSIAFTVLADNRADGAYHVYLGELARGEIKIYELAIRKENEE